MRSGGWPGADHAWWAVVALRGFLFPMARTIKSSTSRVHRNSDYASRNAFTGTLPERDGSIHVGKERNGKDRKERNERGREDDTLTAASRATPTNGPEFSIPQHPARPRACPTAAGRALPHAPAWWAGGNRANPGVDLGREVLKAGSLPRRASREALPQAVELPARLD